MQLKHIEVSRLVYLTTVRRDQGQIFLPAAAQALRERYFFQKTPSSYEELSESKITFEHGLFEGSAISEFSLHTDGLVVSARSSTDILEAFLADMLSWASERLQLVEVDLPNRATFFESRLIVHLDIARARLLPWAGAVQKRLSKSLTSYGMKPFEFGFGGAGLVVDQTKIAAPHPTAFRLEPRMGMPLDSNIYFSVAPLKTDDHVALLEELERSLAQ